MNPIQKMIQMNLKRRAFIRWLLKLISSIALFSIFRDVRNKNKRAFAAPANNQVSPSNNKESVVLQSSNRQQILLKNGLILDGTGNKAFKGSLLINGDKIEDVIASDVVFDGPNIDCSGQVIAPGIIDMHSHMDWVTAAFRLACNMNPMFLLPWMNLNRSLIW